MAAIAADAAPAAAQSILAPGDAVTTQFSGLRATASGEPRPNPDGVVVRGLALGQPGFAPDGTVWERPSPYFTLTARDVGQVFAVTFDRQDPANAYLAASSAYGLYRGSGADGWADAMWGPDAGPGTVWVLNADSGYRPEILVDIATGDRPNGGAGLGDLAFDPWHGQLIVSDLESGLIHRLDPGTGDSLGTFDHGVDGRTSFRDIQAREDVSLEAIAFDPDSAPRIDDCAIPDGEGGEIVADFLSTPDCWNYADFRRRVWGLGVDRDPGTGEVRLYYAVWGGAALGSEAWVDAGDEARSSLWSVAIRSDGDFDTDSVRREMILPALDPDAPAGLAYDTAPVTDIAISEDGTMVLAERGRAMPDFSDAGASLLERGTARILVLEQEDDGRWELAGRYEAGAPEGGDTLRANAAGGIAFGPAFDGEGGVDTDALQQSLWASVDPLCTSEHPCRERESGESSTDAPLGGLLGVDIGDRGLLMPPDDLADSAPDEAYVVALRRDGDPIGSMGDVAIYGADPPVRMIARAREPERPPEPVAETDEDEDVAAERPAAPQIPARRLATDIAISVSAPDECTPGEDCEFATEVANEGAVDHEGPLLLAVTPGNSAVSFVSGGAEGWTCTAANGRVYCSTETASMGAGDAVDFPLVFRLAESYRSPQFQTCVGLTWLGQQGRERIRAVQARLNERGHDAGIVDGAMGPRTAGAISAAQVAAGMPETGQIDGVLVEHLFGRGANITADAVARNDEDCAITDIDLPAEVVAPTPPARQPAQPAPGVAPRHDHIVSRFHQRRSSAQHDPRSSGPQRHDPALSGFHQQFRSRFHEGRYSAPAAAAPGSGGHDQVMSRFHQNFNSSAHDIETSGPMRLHNVRDSMSHEQRGSRAHDPRTSAPRARHDGFTSRWIYGSLDRPERPRHAGAEQAGEMFLTAQADSGVQRQERDSRVRDLMDRQRQNRDLTIQRNRDRQSDRLQDTIRRQGDRMGIGAPPGDTRSGVRRFQE